jgi:molecular chaperone GrpE (heat shock protein)
VDIDKVKETEDIDLLKTQFDNFVNGQKMTSDVMDKVLSRFDVVSFDPMD